MLKLTSPPPERSRPTADYPRHSRAPQSAPGLTVPPLSWPFPARLNKAIDGGRHDAPQPGQRPA